MLLLAATQFFAFSDRFLITVLATPLKHDLALSDAEVGLLQGSAFALLHAAGLPWVGALADRGHRRTLLLGCLVVWTLATLACGLSGSFAALFVSRMLLGLGQSGVVPAALSLLALRVGRARLGRGVSLLTTGGTLGRSLALLVGGATLGWLTGQGGLTLPGFGALAPWQALFVLAALPNLVLLAFTWGIAEPPPPSVPVPLPPWSRAFAWIVRHGRAYLPHTVASTAAILMGQTLTAWAPTFYVRAFKVTPAESGLILGLVVLVAAPVGHIVSGIVLDRAKRKRPRAAPRMLGLGLLLSLPATLVMVFAPGLGLSLGGFAALVAALGFCSPPSLAGIQFLTPVALRGRISGLFIAFVTLVALGAGPALLGLLNDRVFGADGIGRAFAALFATVGGLGLVSAAMAARRGQGVSLFKPRGGRRV
ncbi:Sialic acid transporter NanT [Methylobacterium cerastii]|uniref:Sialic acid transporter NanT n=1 Tax=Methylobacterium cerastii TaxID=932741 RepID=A0ABQ4QNG8_9HYPH|nr:MULTISPECIES: MFS transporter [Methylobacterium]GJD46742.1 Sialic acid transporter NanT [Methylobacterium cerastii]